jgi:hypothetical protein
VFGLTLPYGIEEARKLFISKLFEQPLNIIQDFNNSSPNQEDPKYIIYSAHDLQIANAIIQIANKNLTGVPYASTIFFEVWKPKFSDNDYKIKTLYNG